MMAEFKWIQTSLFLMVMLQFTAAETHRHSFTVRVGDDVSLPCENAVKKKHKCGSYTWLYRGSGNTAAVELVQLGEIVERDEPSSDRLSVLQNCSLVMKKVTVEDVGRYTCREFRSGGEQGSDSVVHLSVISMTEHKDSDKVTLKCSVVTCERCTHTVQWSFNSNDVDKDSQDLKMSQSSCSASLQFLSSHYFYTSRYKLFKCKVTNGNKVQQFDFIPQPSGEKPGEEATTSISSAPPTSTSTTTTATPDARTDCSVVNYIMLVMRVAELVLITVITVLLIRARGRQRPPDDNTVLNSGGSRTVRRSGAAASQVKMVKNDEDEDDGTMAYENPGATSASFRLH
ncbi:uncharacterized protein LOC121622469 isoform X2 [Chelmon rostratus]|uniref:uncharacterized protein LOC121622469 isoform X2 n=1 Tax=Chelmon rostratus TaxID=109905 RepID=UPI001BE8016D|nr:uncharacterized protein LOC121622469 isoform X2 [Chelmon rostratus]